MALNVWRQKTWFPVGMWYVHNPSLRMCIRDHCSLMNDSLPCAWHLREKKSLVPSPSRRVWGRFTRVEQNSKSTQKKGGMNCNDCARRPLVALLFAVISRSKRGNGRAYARTRLCIHCSVRAKWFAAIAEVPCSRGSCLTDVLYTCRPPMRSEALWTTNTNVVRG